MQCFVGHNGEAHKLLTVLVMEPLNTLVQAHQNLATALEASLEHTLFEDAELSASLRERGWVDFPLKPSEVDRLEKLVGFKFSPLLRALFETKEAMPPFDIGVLRIYNSWCGPGVFEANEEFIKLRETYDSELPKLVVLNSDEDFWAVTEEGKVVFVCRNEGNIEKTIDSLEAWLAIYVKGVEKNAADPSEYDDSDFCDEEDFEM